MKNFLFKKQGYTLIEITIALVLVGALAGLSIPRFMSAVEKSRSQEGKQILNNTIAAQQRWMIYNNGVATGTLANLDINISGIKNFGAPVIQTGSSRIRIIRNGNPYRLFGYYAGANSGRIRCYNGGWGNAPCPKLGFDTNGWDVN